MANIIDTAKYILDIYKSTTGIKLHKLLFYCQLGHFLKHNEALIENADFIMEDYGILCPNLYSKIPELVSGNTNRLTKKEILSIEETLIHYAKLTIHELIDLNKKEIPVGTKVTFPEILSLYKKSPTSTNHPSN